MIVWIVTLILLTCDGDTKTLAKVYSEEPSTAELEGLSNRMALAHRRVKVCSADVDAFVNKAYLAPPVMHGNGVVKGAEPEA